MYGRGLIKVCWVTVACRTCARFVELHYLLWLSASERTRVSVSERAKLPAELLVLFSLYLEDREMPSRDGQKAL